MICKWVVFLFLSGAAEECVLDSSHDTKYVLVDEFNDFANRTVGMIQEKRKKGSDLFGDAVASLLRTQVETLNPDYLWETVFNNPTEVPGDSTVKVEMTQLGLYLLPFFFPLMIAVGCLLCLLPCIAFGRLSDAIAWSLLIPQARADKWLKNQQYSRRHHYPRRNRLCLTLCTATLCLTIVLGCLLAAATTRSLGRTLETSTCQFDGITQLLTEGSSLDDENTPNFAGVLNVEKVMNEIEASIDMDVVVNELELLGQAVDNYSGDLKADVLSLGSIMALNINEPVIKKWYHLHSTKPVGEMLMLYSVGWNPTKIRTEILEPLVLDIKEQENDARRKIEDLSKSLREKSEEWMDQIATAKEISEESTEKAEKAGEIFIIFLYSSILFLLFITGLTILLVVPAIWRFSRLNIFKDRHLKALWIFLTVCSILSVIIGGFTLPISVVISDGCYWVDDLQDPQEFEAFLEKSHLTGSLVANLTETCLLPSDVNKGSNLISNYVISSLPLAGVRQKIQELSDMSFEDFPEFQILDVVGSASMIMGLFLLDKDSIGSDFADLANSRTINCGTLEDDITLDFGRLEIPNNIGYSDICGLRTVENNVDPFYFPHLHPNATNKTFAIRSSPMRDFEGSSYDEGFASDFNLAQLRQGLFDETFTCGWTTDDIQCSFFQYVDWISATSKEVETNIMRQYRELEELLDSQKAGIASVMTKEVENVENIIESADCASITQEVDSFLETSCGKAPAELFGISFLFCLISVPFLGLALLVYSLSIFRREYKQEIKSKPEVLQPPAPHSRQVNQIMPYGYMSPVSIPQGHTAMYAVPLPMQAWPAGLQQFPPNC